MGFANSGCSFQLATAAGLLYSFVSWIIHAIIPITDVISRENSRFAGAGPVRTYLYFHSSVCAKRIGISNLFVLTRKQNKEVKI